MASVKRSAPRFRVGDWVSFPYGSRQESAQIIEDRGLLGVHGRRLYRVRLGIDQEDPTTFEMPEENLEAADPKPSWPRVLFDVGFTRKGKTNHWVPSIKREQLIDGVNAKGAVAYSTARWESTNPRVENLVIVTVLVECDPRHVDQGSHVQTSVRRALAQSAQMLASELFMGRHPEAVIKQATNADHN
jgi:hypothetical protein